VKTADVVTALLTRLPLLDDRFATLREEVAISKRSGNIARAVFATPHLMTTGDLLLVVGAVTPISISSFTRSGTVGTITTVADHDLTSGQGEPGMVRTTGANEAEFNTGEDGAFTVLSVPGRRTLTVAMADSGPTVATGSPVLWDASSVLRSYNGLYPVTVIDADTVDYTCGFATALDPVGSYQVFISVRIAGAASPERAAASYSAKTEGELWLWVVLEDTIAAQDTLAPSGVVSGANISESFRQRVTQAFSVYLFVPATGSRHGSAHRDIAESVFPALCRSLLGVRFDSYLAQGAHYQTLFVAHGTAEYDDSGGTVYVHQYQFQALADIIYEDTVGAGVDVAFRDIALTLGTAIEGTGEIVSDIDLDDSPE
jgi:hypothetical protein